MSSFRVQTNAGRSHEVMHAKKKNLPYVDGLWGGYVAALGRWPNLKKKNGHGAGEFPDHFETCTHAELECGDCGITVQRQRLAYHLESECAHRLETCRYGCGVEVKVKDRAAHKEVCPEARSN